MLNTQPNDCEWRFDGWTSVLFLQPTGIRFRHWLVVDPAGSAMTVGRGDGPFSHRACNHEYLSAHTSGLHCARTSGHESHGQASQTARLRSCHRVNAAMSCALATALEQVALCECAVLRIIQAGYQMTRRMPRGEGHRASA